MNEIVSTIKESVGTVLNFIAEEYKKYLKDHKGYNAREAFKGLKDKFKHLVSKKVKALKAVVKAKKEQYKEQALAIKHSIKDKYNKLKKYTDPKLLKNLKKLGKK